jgi:NADH-quinone oxidoreductase subunit H
MVIVGAAAAARPDGAAVLALAAGIALAASQGKDAGWHTFNILHTAASRAAGLDLGFVPGEGGLDTAAMLAAASAGRLDVVYLLGADEVDMLRLGKAFVIYQGSHGDAGAQRADVILPGSAYTEKSATYVNTEGRAQMTSRAAFPPGDAKEDWAILRALSAQVGHKLPYDSLDQLRAMYKEARRWPVSTWSHPPTGLGSMRWRRAAGPSGLSRSVRRCATSISPMRSREHPRSWPSSARSRRPPSRGRPARMASTWSWPEIWQAYLWPLLVMVFQSVVLLVALLIVIAFLLLMDRKVWAAVQMRRGPNVVGPFGLLQSFADLLKFVLKEPLIPAGADKGVFCWRLWWPRCCARSLGRDPLEREQLGRWVISDLNVGVLYLFAISSLGVYGIIMGGWASNSKYPFLGSLRSAAQMVSYEVSIGFVIITVLLCVGSLNLTDVVNAQKLGPGTYAGMPNTLLDWNWLKLLPMFVVFFISALAETNRPPFDLPEAESELVAGFAVEYSSTPYLLFMLGEYVAITTMCALTTIMFLGGWLPPVDVWPLNLVSGFVWFMLKVVFVFFMFAMVKAFVPRYRYDQLMRLGWKVFLPLSLIMVVAVAAVLHFFELAP